jgi:glyoxylate utilization-related uncharacterized protein
MQPLWFLTRDGDPDVLRLYLRHYSCKKNKRSKLFVGPGEKVVLVNEDKTASFVWRRFIDDSGQRGVNCAMFRNEGKQLSSELIRQACRIANAIWPDCRRYTYVNAAKIASGNPGYCFKAAGWAKCGVTKRGLVVLEDRSVYE